MKSAKSELVLNALLSYPTIREAAASVPVPESTVYRYLKHPDFKARYEAAKARMVEDAVTFMQTKLSEATQIIVGIMGNAETAPQVRLNAAKAIMDCCMRLTEQAEIMRRLEQLEEAVDNEGGDYA